jgi:hypothetical protein
MPRISLRIVGASGQGINSIGAIIAKGLKRSGYCVFGYREYLQRADGMLVVGSSLMVYSGFRFAQMADRAGIPIAAVNLGRTRADQMLTLKVEQSCERALAFLL